MENILLIVLLILNILDTITTYIGIKKYNLSEQNPVIKYLINKVGIIGSLIIIKGILISIILYCLIMGIVVGYWIVFPLIVLYIFIVVHNYKLIKTHHENL